MHAMTTTRPAVPADAAAIAEVHTRTWQRAYRGVVPDAYLQGLQPEIRQAFWEKELEHPTLAGSVVLVAEDLSGFVALGPSRDEDRADAWEVYALYVLPDSWGTGTGAALLEAGLAQVPAGTPLTLWVLEENPRARGFYEQQGFTADGTSKVVELGGRPLVEVRYTRPAA